MTMTFATAVARDAAPSMAVAILVPKTVCALLRALFLLRLTSSVD
jgi:hypothetical protein